MSHLSQVFNSVPVKIMDRSGFDMSHENLFTATVGTLIPASVEEVMPGDIVSTGASLAVELPPLATNFKGRVDAKLEAFFVPNRIVWAGWQDFICRSAGSLSATSNVIGGTGVVVPGYSISTTVPRVNLLNSTYGAGSLADYLGVKKSSGASTDVTVNALPFLAYQKIWDDWYRDSNVQQPFFIDGVSGSEISGTSGFKACAMPYIRTTGILNEVAGNYASANSVLGYNGTDVRTLRQRNFAKDYFTTMTTQPQAGAAAGLQWQISVDAQGSGTTGFNISTLRAANSLQKWLERNNLGGTRYYDQILAHYGVLPPDANVNRPVLLGSMTSPVVVNSVYQNSNNEQGTLQGQGNPYGGFVGAAAGHGVSFNKDRLINNFEVKEHGYIIVLFSLVPHAYYSTGSRRYLTSRLLSTDFAFPEFANIGDQPVYKEELTGQSSSQSKVVVGYNQRYSEYKFHDDEIHGKLRDGYDLSAFVLQRGFNDSVTISSSLLEIPTNYMDGVMNVNSDVSGFNAIVDCYFDSKMLRVLPEYSLPSL